MYWKNPRTVRRRTVRHRRVFDSDGMDIKKTPRTDARHASIVRQGLEWALTYGQRSATAFLLVRKVPRPVVERIPISMDGRGRALVVIRQSRRRWEDAYLHSDFFSTVAVITKSPRWPAPRWPSHCARHAGRGVLLGDFRLVKWVIHALTDGAANYHASAQVDQA